MKTATAIAIMIVTTISALYIYKTDISCKTTDIDLFSKALSAYNKQLPQELNFTTEPNRDDIYIWARYILAPIKLYYNKQAADTTLFIRSINYQIKDHNQSEVIIWDYSDSKYKYSLLKSNP